MNVDEDLLERFHRILVDEIRSKRPEYLSGPFTVAEIYQDLVPYSSHRDRLGISINGDYEDALLRLLAGEGGRLLLESEHALRDLQKELRSSNPNTGLYREFAAVDVRLNPSFGSDSMNGPEGETKFEFEPVPMEDLAPSQAVGDEVGPLATGQPADGESGPGISECRWCKAALPTRSDLKFCPYCGTDVRVVPCRQCGGEVEPDWSFCISCGTEVAA